MNYTIKDIDKMRLALAKWELENFNESHIWEILLHGCTGWTRRLDREVIREFEELFPKEERDSILIKN